jgi:hypothetical protein
MVCVKAGLYMDEVYAPRRLGKGELYKCPFQHVHPKHKQAFFKDFDKHFRVFGDREDHFEVVQLHEQLAWTMRRAASEKRPPTDEDLENISLKAWLDAIKQCTGKPVQVLISKGKK